MSQSSNVILYNCHQKNVPKQLNYLSLLKVRSHFFTICAKYKRPYQHFYLTNPLSELRMQCSPHEDGSIVPLSSPFKRPRQTFVTPFHQALLEIIHKTRHTDGNSGPILLHILIIFICMLPGTKQSRDLLVRWTES